MSATFDHNVIRTMLLAAHKRIYFPNETKKATEFSINILGVKYFTRFAFQEENLVNVHQRKDDNYLN